MKKIKLIGILLVSSIVISGCSSSNTKETEDTNNSSVQFFKDSQTKCEYVIYNSGGITPRMIKENGKLTQKGCKE